MIGLLQTIRNQALLAMNVLEESFESTNDLPKKGKTVDPI